MKGNEARSVACLSPSKVLRIEAKQHDNDKSLSSKFFKTTDFAGNSFFV